MKIGYHVGKLTCSYDNGLKYHVEGFARDLDLYCKNTRIENVDDGIISKAKQLIAYMAGVQNDPELYTLLANLLMYYAIDLKKAAEENNIEI